MESHDAMLSYIEKHEHEEDSDLVQKIVSNALRQHLKDTAGEAGRPEGRTLPELVIGAQRYPDPSIWEPEDIEAPLTIDEGYGDVVDFILENMPEDPEI